MKVIRIEITKTFDITEVVESQNLDRQTAYEIAGELNKENKDKYLYAVRSDDYEPQRGIDD